MSNFPDFAPCCHHHQEPPWNLTTHWCHCFWWDYVLHRARDFGFFAFLYEKIVLRDGEFTWAGNAQLCRCRLIFIPFSDWSLVVLIVSDQIRLGIQSSFKFEPYQKSCVLRCVHLKWFDWYVMFFSYWHVNLLKTLKIWCVKRHLIHYCVDLQYYTNKMETRKSHIIIGKVSK